MTRERRFLVVVAGLLVALPLPRAASAAQTWRRVDTPNFVMIGTASESHLRALGVQFEGFREALTRLLSSTATTTAVPTIVIEFPDDKTFTPFQPVYNGKPVRVGGLFVPRRHVNYVLLGADRGPESLRLVFHEYSHLVISNVAPMIPVWLNEGIAEYYSSFRLESNGRKVTIGWPIESHLLRLQDAVWLPIKDLIATTHDSPHYNESSQRSVFYPEAWALVHMLLHGEPNRRPALAAYARDVSLGIEPAKAWAQQFGSADLLSDVRRYLRRPTLQAVQYELSEQIARASGVAQAMTDADVDLTLGEILMALQRPQAAAPRFERALKSAPSSLRAVVDRGLLEPEQQGFKIPDDVKVADDWLANYVAAATLLERGGSDEATLKVARSALDGCLAARADIPNAQVLYASAIDDDTKAVAALRTALGAAPARDDYALSLARALAQQHQYPAARDVLGEVIAHPHHPESREQAFSMMRQVVAAEEYARGAARASNAGSGGAPSSRGGSIYYVYRDLKPGEQRAEGSLERIDCAGKRVTVSVRVGDRIARYQATSFDAIQFLTYRDDLRGSIGCGPRTPADPVYVTFVPGDLEGTVVALEFLPKK
jgi:tetratricopeptide (TPR) repeat protein